MIVGMSVVGTREPDRCVFKLQVIYMKYQRDMPPDPNGPADLENVLMFIGEAEEWNVRFHGSTSYDVRVVF